MTHLSGLTFLSFFLGYFIEPGAMQDLIIIQPEGTVTVALNQIKNVTFNCQVECTLGDICGPPFWVLEKEQNIIASNDIRDEDIFAQRGITFSSATTTAVISIPDTVENNNTLVSCAAFLFGSIEFSYPPVELIIIGPPLPPEPILVINSSSQLDVHWEIPYSNELYPVENYDILILNISSGNVLDSVLNFNGTTYVYTFEDNVEYCQVLTVNVTAVSALGLSAPGSASRGFPIAPSPFQSDGVNVEVTFQDNENPLAVVSFVAPLICEYQTANYTLTIEDTTDPELPPLTRESTYSGNNRSVMEMFTSGLQINHNYTLFLSVVEGELNTEVSTALNFNIQSQSVNEQDADNATFRECPVVDTRAGNVFMLGGITYPNNTAVILEHIGEEDKNSLLCITTDIHCCQTNKQGNFYYPNGELVLPLSQASSSRQNLYLTHNNGSIGLKRQPGETFPPLGKYRCEIPDTRGTLQNLFINIGTTQEPAGMVSCPECPAISDCPTQQSHLTSPSDITPETVPGTTPEPAGMVSCPECPAVSDCSTQQSPLTSPPDITPEIVPGLDLGRYRCEIPGTLQNVYITISETIQEPDHERPTTQDCPTKQLPVTSPIEVTPDTIPDIHFELNGEILANNSAVDLNDIGQGDSALLCRTNLPNCCRTLSNRFGEFFYPSGLQVPINARGEGFYRDRGEQIIRLNRREGVTSPTGRFRCAIPDANRVMRNVYITVN